MLLIWLVMHEKPYRTIWLMVSAIGIAATIFGTQGPSLFTVGSQYVSITLLVIFNSAMRHEEPSLHQFGYIHRAWSPYGNYDSHMAQALNNQSSSPFSFMDPFRAMKRCIMHRRYCGVYDHEHPSIRPIKHQGASKFWPSICLSICLSFSINT